MNDRVTSFKEIAHRYHSAVSHYDIATVERMIDENYIQHNPMLATGRAAFLAMLPKLKEHGTKIRNIRMLEDAQHIIMHHQWRNAFPFGFNKAAAFHIIRFDSQALICEHWSVMMKDCDETGTSLTDGECSIEDLARTNDNKRQIRSLFSLLTEDSKQSYHSAWKEYFCGTREHPHLLEDFTNPKLKYSRQHKIFGEGNFCLSISQGTFLEKSSAIYDLFCLKDGKIANHWRILQEIPIKNLANLNTMFGF